jgi:glycosyltransferase involved in cell wall biosynthesis
MTYITRTSNAFCKSLFAIVNSLEEFFARNSDVLLGVSDKIFLTFRRKPKNCFTIMNCPEDQFITTSGIDENLFKIIYTGAVRRGRGLEVIANIVSELSNVQLNITGKIKDLNLQNRFQSIPNIKYHGFLEREKLLDLEIKSDAMIALYDLNLQSQYEYGMANKVLEAMMCGIPVITNISHDLINDTKCGIIVKYDDIDQIKSAIVTLRDDPSLRKLYGNNGRKAYLEKYNWTKMEEKLYNIYQQLLSDNSKAENPQL